MQRASTGDGWGHLRSGRDSASVQDVSSAEVFLLHGRGALT